MGNEKALSNSDSIWEELILNAKDRQCFFNVDEDEDLQTVIMEVKKNQDQPDDTYYLSSMLLRNTTCKVSFLFINEFSVSSCDARIVFFSWC